MHPNCIFLVCVHKCSFSLFSLLYTLKKVKGDKNITTNNKQIIQHLLYQEAMTTMKSIYFMYVWFIQGHLLEDVKYCRTERCLKLMY